MNLKAFAILSAVSTICLLPGAFAQADECTHRIHFLPVLQPIESVNGTIENLDAAAKVQFDISQYLSKHKELPIFSEQVWSDKTMKTVSPEFAAAAKDVQSHFPQGLPDRLELMNQNQKSLLVNAGGETINLILGKNELLRRTIDDDKTAEAHFGKIQTWMEKNPNAQEPSAEIASLMFEKRDGMALDQVNKFFAANLTQKDAIVLFGIEHRESFKALEGKFPARCILTPFEFQSVKMPYEEAEPSSAPVKQSVAR